MTITLAATVSGPAARYGEAEWKARVDLAACYRLLAHFGMTDLVYNHATARVPGTERILINPYGLMYDEITASSLVCIDIEGRVLDAGDSGLGINAAGYVIHSAVHAARADVECVIHTHTRAGMAVSALACGLLPLTQTSMRFLDIGYHDYEGVALELDERARLVADLGMRSTMILRNHGLLAVGPSVAQAFNTLYWLENACKVQVDALSCNRPLQLPDDAVVQKTWRLYQPEVRRPYGEMEWPAMRRLMDRFSPGYDR